MTSRLRTYLLNTRSALHSLGRERDFETESTAMLNSGLATRRFGALVMPAMLLMRLFDISWFEGGRRNLIAVLRAPHATEEKAVR